MDSTAEKPAEVPAATEPPPYSPGGWTYPAPGGEEQGAPAGAYPPPTAPGAPPGYPPGPGPAYPPPPAGGAYPPPPAGGAYPPAPGYPAYPSGQPGSTQVTLTTTTVPRGAPSNHVVLVSTCPSCHSGMLQDQFTTCGILLAIFFFPIGVFCCLVMRERVCTNCRATFS